MGRYKQMSLSEREELYRLHGDGITLREIGRRLARSHSSISRELRRNGSPLGYLPDRAHRMTSDRRHHRLCRLDSDTALRSYVLDRLAAYWSPQQIAGRMKCKRSKRYICKETIYRWIYSEEGINEKRYILLPKRKRKRTSRYKRLSRGGIPYATAINKRPDYINNRKQFGHWEGDLVLFGIHRCSNLTTLVERKTRYGIILLNGFKYTQTVIGNIDSLLSRTAPNVLKSITFDRGTEFAHHYKLDTHTFFCDPASPWQKGTNENFNGRLRRFLPKGTRVNKLNQQHVAEIMNIMNNTPRKCLGYKTPQEVFNLNLKQSGAL